MRFPLEWQKHKKKRLYEIYEERLKHSNRKKPAELLIFAGCLLHGMKTKRTILPFSKVELELKKLFNLKIKTTDGKFIKDLAEELKIFSEIEKREIVDAVTGNKKDYNLKKGIKLWEIENNTRTINPLIKELMKENRRRK
ncbi:MAG: hypothetical protein COT90_05005 [Candidatus Diapherotrites archaeon CG10_big_fil_rev_8_21_14_0_10_31_34]|nr:MAG: hypothetical protein COT90_05005 [Candidatus Diapherotrites archaeon CG10_big_fil_rev_8_21_14_0_10_31_34]